MRRDLDRFFLPLLYLPLLAMFLSLGVAAPSSAVVVFEEDFESLVLGPNQEEGEAGVAVWTDVAPTGWTVDRTGVPGYDQPANNNGVKEWIGWNFADKDWWSAAAGDQLRSQFTNASGTVLVADPDEWDDAAHPDSAANGWYNTTITTPAISLSGVPTNKLNLSFDSSWRDEFDANFHQRVNITVSYDGGTPIEVHNWESDPASPNFHDDAPNEFVSIDLNNPAGANDVVIKFGMFDAGNDWWWALDNIALAVPAPLTLRVDPVSGAMELRGNLDVADITGYEITSASGALDAAGWQAGNLAAQGIDSIGTEPGESWESLFFTSNQLAETFLLGSSLFDSTRVESLGTGFMPGSTQDLLFEYSEPDGSSTSVEVEYATIYKDADFDEDGMVDGTDLATLEGGFGLFLGNAVKSDGDANRDGLVNGADFLHWQRQFEGGAGSLVATLPEPSTWAMCGMALLGLTVISRRRP